MIRSRTEKSTPVQRRFSHGKASRLLLLLGVLFVSLVWTQEATAAKRRVIFQLANLRQWVDIGYQYEGSTTDSKVGSDRGSQDHELEEIYHVGIDYAILSQRLANGTLELDIGSNQAYSAQTGNSERSDKDAGLGLEFLFDMVLFERRPYPVSLTANRIQRRINAPFAENYTLTSATYSAGLSMRNSVFPFQLNYRYFTNETAGLSLDRSQVADELNLESTLNSWDISTTKLRALVRSSRTDFEASTTPSLQTDSYDLGAQNILSWGSLDRKNSLNSWYQLRRDSGASERRAVQWSEDLELQLGRALSVGGSYGYNKSIVPRQERLENKVRGWIEHRLFKSLTTRYDYSQANIDYLSGLDRNFRHQLSVAYSKQLPKNSIFTFGYSYGYGEIDRDLADQQIRVPDEVITVDPFGTGYLQNADVVEESVEIFTNDGFRIPVSAANYSVAQAGNQTRIDIDPAIVALYGDSYIVVYAHRINNSIEYSSASHSFNTSLGLFNQRFRVYSTVSLGDQELIDGTAEVSPLTQQTFVQVGIDGNFEQTTLGSTYSYLDTAISTDKTFEAFISHLRPIGRSLLSLRLTERYSVTEQKEGLLAGGESTTSKRNSLLFNADYRKPLWRNTTLNLQGRWANLRGEMDEDELLLGTALESRWYKFELLFNANVAWVIQEEVTTREDLLSVKLRRYF